MLFYTQRAISGFGGRQAAAHHRQAWARKSPFRRMRIVESWLTDRLHDGGVLASTRSPTGPSALLRYRAARVLAGDQLQPGESTSSSTPPRLTLHGAIVTSGAMRAMRFCRRGVGGLGSGQLRRNVGLGRPPTVPPKISFRPKPRADRAAAHTSGPAFTIIRRCARRRDTSMGSLNLSADFSLLINQNPLPGINYDYSAASGIALLSWSPQGGKNWDFQGTYSRSTVNSNIGYLDPEILRQPIALSRQCPYLLPLCSTSICRITGLAPKISAGGSFFISSGSRPTQYYQPTAKLTVPLSKKFSWFAEWSYYGYGEAFYLYEGFRTHIVTTGLRLTR